MNEREPVVTRDSQSPKLRAAIFDECIQSCIRQRLRTWTEDRRSRRICLSRRADDFANHGRLSISAVDSRNPAHSMFPPKHENTGQYTSGDLSNYSGGL